MSSSIQIVRSILLEASLPQTIIDHVQIHRIELAPGQVGGLHFHPGPVTGYIVEGQAIFQIAGESERILPQGSAFYEPAGVRIQQFGNASSETRLVFVAVYLLQGDQSLIEMLSS
jgi:quercetin dioxygenase-like cupin family protein